MDLLQKFSRKDLKFSIITGLITGVFVWRILFFLGAPTYGLYHPHAYLVVIVPLLWIVGVNFGYFLGRWMPFFNQFGRFAAVGFTNAAIDFGILNLQIGLTGISDGWFYSVFKAVSFAVAVINSYIFNKLWVFDAGESGGGKTELGKFIAVNIVGIIVNVGVASIVVNFIPVFGGFSDKVWANIGGIAGSAVAIFLTFFGARLFVFKK